MLLNYKNAVLVLSAALCFISVDVKAQETKKIFLGYFEGGRNSVHSALREEFERQAQLLAPKGTEFIFIPQGYRSAGWKRDSSRICASELARVDKVDVMITMGPWVIEDLIQAGYKKPILAMYRFEPLAEGIVDNSGNPRWPNVTVHGKTNKIESDLTALAGLFRPKKIGFLFFPSSNEHDSVVAGAAFLARRLNMEMVSSDAVDNFGTFAFFRALENLPKDIDALYLGPLWGLDEQKMSALFDRLAASRIPFLTYDASPAIQLGSLVSNAGYTYIAEARFNAEKLIQIVNKERPSDLPTGFEPTVGLTINLKTLGAIKKPVPAEALRQALKFGTYAPEGASYYSVTDAISRLLSHHPGYHGALEATHAAEAELGKSRASLYPQIKAEGVATWLDDNAINNLERSLSNEGFRGSLIAEQELYSKESSTQRAMARQNKILSELSELDVRYGLIQSVEHAFLLVLENTENFVNAQQNRLIIDRLRELSWPRERFESRPARERNRLEIEHLSASIAVNDAEAARSSATAHLNSLFNLPAETPFLLDTAAFSLQSIYTHFSALSQIVATTEGESRVAAFFQESAQANNRALQLAQKQVDRATMQKSAAGSARFPALSLRGSLNFTDELAESSLLTEKSPNATIGARLELPLFLGGKTGKERQIRTAEFNQAEFMRDAVSLETMSKVAGLSSEFFTTLSSVPIAIQEDQKAAQYLVEVTRECEAGLLSLSEFIDAVRIAHDARSNLTSLQYRYFHVVCELVHTIGWDGSDKTPFDRIFISKIRERFGSSPTK